MPIAHELGIDIAIPNPKKGIKVPLFGPKRAHIVREDKEDDFTTIFGRLSSDDDRAFNEGGEISCRCMREFFEPEYFPEHFFPGFDSKCEVANDEALPFFPTLNFWQKCSAAEAKAAVENKPAVEVKVDYELQTDAAAEAKSAAEAAEKDKSSHTQKPLEQL